MTWVEIANLIIAIGLPAAEKLWQKAAAGTDPTQADFDELRGLANLKAKDQALVVLKNLDIDPTSDKGKMILALVG